MSDKIYPANWQVRDSYDPSEHLINLKGKEYLNAQNRLLWFVKDQRSMILTGAATTSYVVRTELVELDREAGYAHFKTYVRDVLGNEVTMYGSETAKDFGDYAEKASTKSLGRALLALGYGTANAMEMDEGERVVDSPIEHKEPLRKTPLRQLPPQQVKAAISDMENHRTSREQQDMLGRTLRTNGYDTVAKVEYFLLQVLGRNIDVADLGRGESDLTIGELRTIEQKLGIGEPDLKALPVGTRGK